VYLLKRSLPDCFWGYRESEGEEPVARILRQLWSDQSGQDIAEYAVMLAVILVIVVAIVLLAVGTVIRDEKLIFTYVLDTKL